MDKYIVLDLDETVINSVEQKDGLEANLVFEDGYKLNVMKRPYFDEFMYYLKEGGYTVFVWSAGEHEYVRKVVSNFFPYKPKLIWSREKCEQTLDLNQEYSLVKPLEKLYRHMKLLYPNMWTENELYFPDSPFPNMHNTIMIDDREEIAVENKYNHIKIEPFDRDPKDRELLRIMDILDNRL